MLCTCCWLILHPIRAWIGGAGLALNVFAVNIRPRSRKWKINKTPRRPTPKPCHLFCDKLQFIFTDLIFWGIPKNPAQNRRSGPVKMAPNNCAKCNVSVSRWFVCSPVGADSGLDRPVVVLFLMNNLDRHWVSGSSYDSCSTYLADTRPQRWPKGESRMNLVVWLSVTCKYSNTCNTNCLGTI